jgi:ADP-heptose:LPS heptosyltransferase
MHPDAMRRLDYWAGVPLCFLLTLLVRLRLLFTSATGSRRSPRNVLFIELAEMGTTVLACPAIARLRARYPGCVVYFLLFRQIEESIRVLDVIPGDHVLTIDASSFWTVARDTVRFLRTARRLRLDTAVNLEAFSRFSTILAALSGAATRVGFHPFGQHGLYVGDLLTHKVQYNPHVHTWQSFVALAAALDAPGGDTPLGKFPVDCCPALPRLAVDADTAARVRARVTSVCPAADGLRWIVVNPHTSSLIPVRRWPIDRYADLTARLVADPRNLCIITGTEAERPAAAAILGKVQNSRLVDFTGETTLRELIGLFGLSSILITNDSGPAHFAALTDIHVVVFFGPETPDLYRPLTRNSTVLYANLACSPCVSAYNHRLTPCTNNVCVQHFDVPAVHERVCRLLDP